MGCHYFGLGTRALPAVNSFASPAHLTEPLLTEKQERAVYETVNIFQRWAFGGEEAGGQDERLSRPFEPEILLDLVESPPRRTTVVRFSNVVRGYAAEKRREERGLGHKGRLVTDRDALDMYCYAVQTSRVGRFEVVRGLGKVMKQLTERYVMVRGLIK